MRLLDHKKVHEHPFDMVSQNASAYQGNLRRPLWAVIAAADIDSVEWAFGLLLPRF